MSELSLQRAAQAWCTEKNSHKEMDSDLAEAFAEILDEYCSCSNLGYATTEQLIDEIKARIEVDGNLQYTTVGGEKADDPGE